MDVTNAIVTLLGGRAGDFLAIDVSECGRRLMMHVRVAIWACCLTLLVGCQAMNDASLLNFAQYNLVGVRNQLAAGANVNYSDAEGRTPLMLASNVRTSRPVGDVNHEEWETTNAERHYTIVRVLLDAGANVNAADKHGNTPLSYAAIGEDAAIGGLLLERGANVNTPNDEGVTPFDITLKQGDLEFADLLIARADTDLHSVDKHGDTPLAYAAMGGNVAIGKLLCQRGASVNTCNQEKATPLHIASKLGHRDFVSFLIAHGADTTARNIDNETPRELANKELQKRRKTLESNLAKMQVGPRSAWDGAVGELATVQFDTVPRGAFPPDLSIEVFDSGTLVYPEEQVMCSPMVLKSVGLFSGRNEIVGNEIAFGSAALLPFPTAWQRLPGPLVIQIILNKGFSGGGAIRSKTVLTQAGGHYSLSLHRDGDTYSIVEGE